MLRTLLFSLLLLVPAQLALGAPEDAVVNSYGYDGCDHTVSTNHFELAPGELLYLELDLSQCLPDDLQGMLYFGYKTTRNSSRPLQIKDGIELRILDPTTGEEIDYAAYDGYNGAGKLEHVYIQLESGGHMLLSAQNTSRNKTRKIRLRVSSGL